MAQRGIPGAAAAAETTAALHRDLATLTGSALRVELWNGKRLGPSEGAYRVVLRHPWSARALLLPPTDLAAGEAYVHGDIDIAGDAVAALAAVDRLRSQVRGAGARARLLGLVLRLPRPPRRDTSRRARLRGRRHSKHRDRAAIAFHYDLPQDFYTAFLDSELVYSCAYFTDDDPDLDHAQVRKLDLVCRKLNLRPGMRLLDIGCGWGSLLLHAARHHGVHGIGVTLSQTQADVARERIAAAGLTGRLEVRLADYRDLDETFDAVASVGMIEHVGPENLHRYFAAAHRLTAPGGLCLTHSIVTGDARRVRSSRSRDFAGTYVFPDGGMAPAWRLVRHAEEAGFELVDVEQLRPHYERTLRHWVSRLETNRAQALRAASEVDYRIWRLYMAGSALAFSTRHLGVVQVLGSKGAHLPLGRSWMLPGSERQVRTSQRRRQSAALRSAARPPR